MPFYMRYDARGRGPLEIFIPARRYPQGFALTCDGRSVSVPRDPVNGTVTFRCGARLQEHVVVVDPAS